MFVSLQKNMIALIMSCNKARVFKLFISVLSCSLEKNHNNMSRGNLYSFKANVELNSLKNIFISKMVIKMINIKDRFN